MKAKNFKVRKKKKSYDYLPTHNSVMENDGRIHHLNFSETVSRERIFRIPSSIENKQTNCKKNTHNFRFEWGLNFPVHEFQPIYVSKENMIFDILLSIGSTTKPSSGVFGQELKQESTRILLLFLSILCLNFPSLYMSKSRQITILKHGKKSQMAQICPEMHTITCMLI